jgi:hypothetical protein
LCGDVRAERRAAADADDEEEDRSNERVPSEEGRSKMRFGAAADEGEVEVVRSEWLTALRRIVGDGGWCSAAEGGCAWPPPEVVGAEASRRFGSGAAAAAAGGTALDAVEDVVNNALRSRNEARFMFGGCTCLRGSRPPDMHQRLLKPRVLQTRYFITRKINLGKLFRKNAQENAGIW